MRVKNYLLLEEIGSGSFSTVFKAVNATDQSKVYAIKSMRDIPQNVTIISISGIKSYQEIDSDSGGNSEKKYQECGQLYNGIHWKE